MDEYDMKHETKDHAAADAVDPDRRAALRAIATYSGAVGAGATLTVLSAQEAVADQPHSSTEKVSDDMRSEATFSGGPGSTRIGSGGDSIMIRRGGGTVDQTAISRNNVFR